VSRRHPILPTLANGLTDLVMLCGLFCLLVLLALWDLACAVWDWVRHREHTPLGWCLALLLACPALATDETRLLHAIALVETGGVPRMGRSGETGIHQLSPSVIRQHGTRDPRVHLRWLVAQLHRAGVDASPFNIALAWNAGLERTLTGCAPVRSYDYARRVENSYLSSPESAK
jgi:hypothetical protein